MNPFITILGLLLLIAGFFMTSNSEDVLFIELYKALSVIICLNLLRIIPNNSFKQKNNSYENN